MGAPVTYLFVPADRPDRHAKALASGADRVVIDLEDAVRPAGKAAARDAVARAEVDWSRIVLRINDAASPWWRDDLALLRRLPARAVLVPKAEDPADLEEARGAVGFDGAEIVPQIETAAGLENAGSLLRSPGVRRAAFGHLDFAADIGCEPCWEALLLARATLVFRSRLAAREAPIDSVTVDIGDEDGLVAEAGGARRLGFGGKLLIHPRQVAPVARAFAPSQAEAAWARRVVEADAAHAGGALQVDGTMIDKPVVGRARRVLARAVPPDDGDAAPRRIR